MKVNIPVFSSRSRLWALILVSILLVVMSSAILLHGCARDGSDTDEQDGDDDAASKYDDCGYARVTVPEGCDGCHGAPPQTARHPNNNRCFRCHGYVVDEDFNFVQPDLHNNGVVEYAVGCASCHGWSLGMSPPQNLSGQCTAGIDGVGAHEAMRRGDIPAHQTACSNCHWVPLETWEQGHIDGDGMAEVAFKNLAVIDGANPTWDGETCSNVYCHGATLTGGDYKNPKWLDTSGDASHCGACHRITDPGGDASADCSSCHPTSLDSNRNILPRGTHINGHIDMAGESDEKGGL